MANYNGKSIPTDGSKDIITWSEEQKTDIQSALNGVTKADVGLGRVIDERQLFTELKGLSNSSWSQTLKNDTKYLLTSDWSAESTSAFYFCLLTIRNNNIYIRHIATPIRAVFSTSGRTLTVNHSGYWGIYSLIELA